MKKFILLTVMLACGCASSPPPPPQPEGEFRPVNIKPQNNVNADKFGFRFDGDIVDALDALAMQNSQLDVLQPEGQPIPIQVHINLTSTDIAKALKAIGEQGGGQADVVWLSTKNNPRGGKAFVRFSAGGQ